MRNHILLILLVIISILSSISAVCAEIDAYAVANYKKLHSKDIILNVEKGRVYIMVSLNKWEIARTNLKLLAGDKLKIEPKTIATINFYDEFDMHIPESEMTTVEAAGITQLLNGALFRTIYKDGSYISEVVKAPSKVAQYKFRGAIAERDLKMEYSKNKLYKKEKNFDAEISARQNEEANYLRARISQAKNFGNGFTMNYKDSEFKQSLDRDIDYIEREKRRLEVDVIKKMALTESLKSSIAANLANSGGLLDVSASQKQLADMSSQIRVYTQKLDYANDLLRDLYEKQNKINLKPKTREW